jgi:4-amino-4-deoxychorismate lyase/para-aminobenzoate synthetase/4-amino-4-deoxychorismate lyase
MAERVQREGEEASVADFGLIETLLWTRNEGFSLLPEHLRRLGASASALGFIFDEGRVKSALDAAVAVPAAERLRLRLVLGPEGAHELGAEPIALTPPETLWRVAVAKRRFVSAEPMLRHKTTRRELYEEELAASGADEVLFLNERDEVCEGARTNVFLAQGEILLTPPLASGLLPGTLRARLLAEGRAREEYLSLEDFEGREFFMGNSVRGLVRATLL